MLNPFIELFSWIIQLYNYVLIAWLILSWLISFNIVNRYQPVVQRLNFALFRLTDPLLRPIRKYMPDLGGIDISPIVLMLLLNFLNRALFTYFYRIY
jgi:YggT family protein